MMPFLLAPKTASKPRAINMPGNASSASLIIIRNRSNQPRKKPLIAPIRTPPKVAMKTVKTLIETLADAPFIRRLNWSRPNSSVPSQCAALGGARRAVKSSASGLYGVQKEPTSATVRSVAVKAPPIRALREMFFISPSPSGRRTDKEGPRSD